MSLKKIIPFGFLFVVSVQAHADEDKKPTLQDLIKSQNEIVSTYSTYKFEINWIDGKPTVDIFKEIADLRAKKIDDGLVAEIVGSKSKNSVMSNLSFLNTLTSFKPTKVTESWDREFKDLEGSSFLRFDSYDSGGNLRQSEWRNAKTGFKEQEILFGENGKPLNMVFYEKLELNKLKKPFPSGAFITLSLDQVEKKFGKFDFFNLIEVMKICKKTLHRALEMKGLEENEE